MTVRAFTFNPFQTNGYVVHHDGEAALIDAPSQRPDEHRQVLDYLDREGLTLTHLLLTHAHVDHIFGCAFFERETGLTFQAHAEARPFIEHAAEQARFFGVEVEAPSAPETTLAEGDTVTVGGLAFDVLHTPGHSPDSICFVAREEAQAVTGDVLFQGSIGRTQGLPQTSLPQLLGSITEKLFPLGDDVTIYPGHGPTTTIGRERRANPFLQGVEG